MGWSGTGANIFHPSPIDRDVQDGGPSKDADCGGHDQGARPSGEDASYHQNYP